MNRWIMSALLALGIGVTAAWADDEEKKNDKSAARNGVIVEVDAAKSTVVIKVDRTAPVMPLAVNAAITIDGKPAALADLKPGMPITFTMSADNKLVAAIDAAPNIAVGNTVKRAKEAPAPRRPEEAPAPKKPEGKEAPAPKKPEGKEAQG